MWFELRKRSKFLTEFSYPVEYNFPQNVMEVSLLGTFKMILDKTQEIKREILLRQGNVWDIFNISCPFLDYLWTF